MKLIKTQFFLLIAVSFSMKLFAQAEVGPEIKAEVREIGPSMISENEDFLYFAYRDSYSLGKLYLVALNRSDLSLHYEAELPLKSNGNSRLDEPEIQKWWVIDDVLHYYVTQFSSNGKRRELILRKMNLGSGQFISEDLMHTQAVRNENDSIFLDPHYSEKDGRHYVLSLIKKKDRGLFQEKLIIFDDQLQKLNEYELNSAGKGLNTSLREPLIDEDGSIYFFENKRLLILDATRNYERVVEEYPIEENAISSPLSVLKAELDERGYPTVFMSFKRELSFSRHFYEDFRDKSLLKTDDKKSEGFVRLTYDPVNLSWEEPRVEALETGTIALGARVNRAPRFARDLPANLGSYILPGAGRYNMISKPVFDDAGNLYYAISYRSINRFGSQYTFLVYMDRVLISFDPEGKVRWVRNLSYMVTHAVERTSMSFINDDYYDFRLYKSGKQIVFVFNDSPEYAEEGYDITREKPTGINKMVPVVFRFETDGSYQAEIAFNLLDEKDSYFLNMSSMQKSEIDGQCYYALTKGKKMRFARVAF